MKKLVEGDFPDFKFEEKDVALIRERMGGGFKKYDGRFAKAQTLKEFFIAFADMGDQLALSLKGLVGTNNDELIFPRISELLGHYLTAGELVTTLSRRNVK